MWFSAMNQLIAEQVLEEQIRELRVNHDLLAFYSESVSLMVKLVSQAVIPFKWN
jgi:hypothetical protein